VASNVARTFDETAGLVVELAVLAALALMPVAFSPASSARGSSAPIADPSSRSATAARPARSRTYRRPVARARLLVVPAPGLWTRGRTMTEPIARGEARRNGGKRVAALLHTEASPTSARRRRVAATASLASEKERLQASPGAVPLPRNDHRHGAEPALRRRHRGADPNFNHAVEVASGLGSRSLVEGRHFWEIFIHPSEREAMIQRSTTRRPGRRRRTSSPTRTAGAGHRGQTAPRRPERGRRATSRRIDITDRKHRELELQCQWTSPRRSRTRS
jgi:hypothetical protein